MPHTQKTARTQSNIYQNRQNTNGSNAYKRKHIQTQHTQTHITTTHTSIIIFNKQNATLVQTQQYIYI